MARFLAVALAVLILLVEAMNWLRMDYVATEMMRLKASASFEQRTETSALVTRITEAVSTERGYVITGDPEFLAGYRAARSDVAQGFERLRATLSDQPEQVRLLLRLRTLAARKFTEMDRTVSARRFGGFVAAERVIRASEDTDPLNEMRMVSQRMLALVEIERNAEVNAYRTRVASGRANVWFGVADTALIMLGGALVFWRQDTARYRAQLAAYGIAERNRAILESTVDAIAIVTPEGKIETINAAATAMLGYLPEEVEGRDVSAVIRLRDRALPSIPFHRRIGLVDGVLAEPHLPDRKVLHRDGHEIPVDVVLGVMRLPDGDHIVASVRDVSERMQIDRMKDELMSTVSHELRTPLTSVIGALGLLHAGTARMTPAESRRLIEIAENNSRRLIRLINDMLDIDRIQSGRVLLDRQPTDLRDVLKQACQGIQGLADATGIEIHCHVPDAAMTAAVDADRVLQVITNLASNAVHVSPAAGVITLGLTTSQSGGKALVTVDDDGPGIPAEFRDRIFGRFERAKHEGGGGTGLGLAISREIIDRHGGRIWFEDRPVGGTRFAFVLDLLRDRPGGATVDAPPVLVCEDDAYIAGSLCEWVAASGHAAQCVRSGAEARSALAGRHYAALLLDLDLPDENGLDVARALRTLNGTATLPIIVVAGSGADRASIAPGAFGIVDWIEKPVDRERVIAALGRAVGAAGTATSS